MQQHISNPPHTLHPCILPLQAVKAGVNSIEGCEGHLFQVPEILSEEILKKMHAVPKSDIPIITADKLADFDGFLFGFPTRFGAMPAQMKAFFDSTGSQWQSGALLGKPASIFVSVGTQSGGMETTVLTSLTNLAHHGMVIVPTGYSFGPEMYDVNTVRGGSAWGAGCYAGADGSRQPSDLELRMATHQGSYFARVAKKLAA